MTSSEKAPEKVITTLEEFREMIASEIREDYASGNVDEDTIFFETIINDPDLLAGLFDSI